MGKLRLSSFFVLALATIAVTPGQSQAASLVTLVTFSGTNGASPRAALLADADGNLFGTTAIGGKNNGGTVFEIAKTAAGYAPTVTTLANFCSLANCIDGSNPASGLIADAHGNLFGTTAEGGTTNNGTAFEIAKTTGGYASTAITLVSFDGLDGSFPEGSLIADARGNLFGTTARGGTNDYGTVFEIAKTATGYANTPTTLVNFCSLANCADGALPEGSLIADTHGNLFGTTSDFTLPTFVGGTVFEIAKLAGRYASTPTTLVTFNGTDGMYPLAGLIADADGNLFGTTFGGGTSTGGGGGTVFKTAKTSGGYASTPTTLVSFCTLANCADGLGPKGGLIADADGNLFGTTQLGGTASNGNAFEIAKTAGGYASTPTTLVSFCLTVNCPDSGNPSASLIADAQGNLFGTTSGGTSTGNGAVFEITGSGFVPFHTFAGTPGTPYCLGESVWPLVRQYGGPVAAAAALGYPSVWALGKAIFSYCEGGSPSSRFNGRENAFFNELQEFRH